MGDFAVVSADAKAAGKSLSEISKANGLAAESWAKQPKINPVTSDFRVGK